MGTMNIKIMYRIFVCFYSPAFTVIKGRDEISDSILKGIKSAAIQCLAASKPSNLKKYYF